MLQKQDDCSNRKLSSNGRENVTVDGRGANVLHNLIKKVTQEYD